MEEERRILKASAKRASLGRIFKWQGCGPRPALGRWEGLPRGCLLVALGGWSHRNNPRTLAKKSTVSGHYQFGQGAHVWKQNGPNKGYRAFLQLNRVRPTGLHVTLGWNNGHSNYWDWISCQHCGMGAWNIYDLIWRKKRNATLTLGVKPYKSPLL